MLPKYNFKAIQIQKFLALCLFTVFGFSNTTLACHGNVKLQVCNQMNQRVIYTYALDDPLSNWDSHYRSYGWHTLAPNECRELDTYDSCQAFVYAKTSNNRWVFEPEEEIEGEADYAICVPSKDSVTTEYAYRFDLGWGQGADHNHFDCETDSRFDLKYGFWIHDKVNVDTLRPILQTLNFSDDNAYELNPAPRTGGSGSGPVEESPNQKRKRQIEEEEEKIGKLEQEIQDLEEKIENCQFENIKNIQKEDLLLFDLNYLRNLNQCSEQFGELADEVEKIRQWMNELLNEATLNVSDFNVVVDNALTAANLAADESAFNQEGLLDFMPDAIYSRDEGQDAFYLEVSENLYIKDFLTPIVAASNYEPFLITSKAWANTYLNFGEKIKSQAEGLPRQLGYIQGVKAFLTYFDANGLEKPANPVPDEIYSLIESDLIPKHGEKAKNLESTLRRWTGESPNPNQFLLLETIRMLAGAYQYMGAQNQTLEAHVVERTKLLVEDVAAAAFEVHESNSLLPRGAFLNACEMASATQGCTPGGTKLVGFNRLQPAQVLTGNPDLVALELQKYFTEFPAEEIPTVMQTPERVFHLMERLTLR